MGKLAEVKDIVDAVLYLAEAGQVTGDSNFTNREINDLKRAGWKDRRESPDYAYLSAEDR
jgi:hypothetical protein